MKINLITTAFIALGLASSSATFAASNNTPINDHMVITADRTMADQYLALSATQIIDKADIERIQPHNITDLLDQVAGISVAKQGGGGQSSTIFMRGTNSNHTLILVDGVRVSSATLGTANFSGIAVENIERIEIVKGPRAALWGSDAIGGVIQIFTKQLMAGDGVISAGVGSHGLWKSNASIGLGNEVNSLTLSVSAEQSNGFSAQTKPGEIYETDNDGYDRYSFGLIGQSQFNDQFSMHLMSRWEQGGAEYDPRFAGTANENTHENYLVRVAGQYKTNSLFTEVSVATSQDQGSTFGNGVLKADSQEIKTTRDQISLLSQLNLNSKTSLTAGVDWYNEKVSTNKDLVSWIDGVQAWDVGSRNVKAFYLQSRYQGPVLLLEGAVRRDDIEGLAKKTTYNASVGLQLSDHWLLSFNRSTGFKAPSFNDLYWPGAGNPNLKPESITSNEILVRNQFTSGTVELSVYQSSIDNLIDWAEVQPGIWQPSNINKADIKGVEFNLAIRSGAVSHQLALAYIDAKDSVQDIPLGRRPEFTALYNIGYQWQQFTLNTSVNYRDESMDATSKYAAILDDYWLANVALSYQLTEQLLFNLKVNNLFDTEYQTSKNYVADGVNYVINVSYQF
ncbi:MAG: TonB-dependent receptor [Gammaproteobacteria bacterium]|nr:TonB-dependent receptor [Gammaproteobacteria bacterium]